MGAEVVRTNSLGTMLIMTIGGSLLATSLLPLLFEQPQVPHALVVYMVGGLFGTALAATVSLFRAAD